MSSSPSLAADDGGRERATNRTIVIGECGRRFISNWMGRCKSTDGVQIILFVRSKHKVALPATNAVSTTDMRHRVIR